MWGASTENRSAGLFTSCKKEGDLRREMWRLHGDSRQLRLETRADACRWADTHMGNETLIQQREAAFHDAWANSTRVEDVLVREVFEVPTALQNQFILLLMASFSGKTLLHLGPALEVSPLPLPFPPAPLTVRPLPLTTL